jgi:hypothetical protein
MSENLSTPKKRIAVCYWGLIRTLREVFPSQKKYVFDELDKLGIEYDTYLHTWKPERELVWDRLSNIPVDYRAIDIVNPVASKIDEQNAFLQSIHFGDYYYPREYEWEPQLIINHLCALESQKRCTELCLHSGKTYDYVMFLRPDTLVDARLPVETIFTENFSKNTIAIPDFEHWEGLNDRFAILHYDAVKPYSHRIDDIIEFRRTCGRIVSEKYVKHVVNKYYNLALFDFHFDLLRPDGKLNGNF